MIDELRVLSRVLEEGGETTVEITIPEDAVGKGCAFYCNIGSHRARGIEGGVKDFAKNLSLSNNTG
ncbi:hypothetical protein IPN35_01675 [Candidatus Peregrinibacteria bacterium]|nr:MAG: hypothetical protein IPN35_01675 [Candidatus Peregrinibacteria bacterium]